MSSLETLAEILTRVEQKVDKTNGSVARVMERVDKLEEREIIYRTQIGMLKFGMCSLALPVVVYLINFTIVRVIAYF